MVTEYLLPSKVLYYVYWLHLRSSSRYTSPMSNQHCFIDAYLKHFNTASRRYVIPSEATKSVTYSFVRKVMICWKMLRSVRTDLQKTAFITRYKFEKTGKRKTPIFFIILLNKKRECIRQHHFKKAIPLYLVLLRQRL